MFIKLTFIWEERCLGEVCVETVSGEQWVKTFCSEIINGKQTCNFVAEGKQYSMPLEELRMNIDINEVSGCAKFSCQTKVFIKELNYRRLNK